jgi:glycyl-tRNA synthetase beta chain
LIQSYRRGINILSAEEKKNNIIYAPVAQQTRFDTDYEQNLFKIIANIENDIKDDLLKNNFDSALLELLGLQNPLSDFFEHLMVNDSNPQIRQNRLGLLSYLRQVIHKVADFSKIEC